jgi:hypothetical protein
MPHSLIFLFLVLWVSKSSPMKFLGLGFQGKLKRVGHRMKYFKANTAATDIKWNFKITADTNPLVWQPNASAWLGNVFRGASLFRKLRKILGRSNKNTLYYPPLNSCTFSTFAQPGYLGGGKPYQLPTAVKHRLNVGLLSGFGWR